MKKLIVLAFTLVHLIGYSQNTNQLDTIYCDIKNTSSIILPDAVDFIDIGNINEYAGQIKNNIVFIKPLKENIPTTTLLISTAGNIYYSTIKWQPKAKKYFYDYKNKSVPVTSTPNNATATINKSSPPDVPKDNVQDKLKKFKEIGNEIKTLGIVGSTFQVAVSLIRNDENNTYLKIVASNKSSIPFKLDFISFQYYQDMKKGVIRKSKKAPIDVFPISAPDLTSIEPLKTEALYYVIPTYALDNKGYLNINIREKAGDRILKLKIKGKTIQKSGQI